MPVFWLLTSQQRVMRYDDFDVLVTKLVRCLS